MEDGMQSLLLVLDGWMMLELQIWYSFIKFQI